MRIDGNASDEPIDNAVIARMKQFKGTNKFKKVALKVTLCLNFIALSSTQHPQTSLSNNAEFLVADLLYFSYQVIAESLSEEEITGLIQLFKSMDTDNSGTITFDELKEGLTKLGTKLSESELRQLMEAV